MNPTLFPQNAIRIARLTSLDTERQTDHFRTFRSLVLENAPMYPGIGEWLRHRVIPGLRAAERVAYVGYCDEVPVISACVKLGARAKFCHLRITDQLQDQHLGDMFFSLMAREVRGHAREVHFTLPESLWARKSRFFKSFGFELLGRASRQYRAGDEELICTAAFPTVWQAVVRKIARISEDLSVSDASLEDAIVLSIKDKFAKAIFAGTKRVEIRKSFSTKWTGHRVSFYVSAPVSGLVGEATIRQVVVGAPENIWSKFGKGIGCRKEYYEAYTRSWSKVSAILLEDLTAYNEVIPREELSTLIDGNLRPPQTHCSLRNCGDWARAISLAALLHGGVRSSGPVAEAKSKVTQGSDCAVPLPHRVRKRIAY